MARKKTTRRKTKGQGSYWFDKKNQRHVWTIEHDGTRHRVTDRDEETASLQAETNRSREGAESGMSTKIWCIPPQIPPQTQRTRHPAYAEYRVLMLVPGTGHDPVTSCFSGTKTNPSHPIGTRKSTDLRQFGGHSPTLPKAYTTTETTTGGAV